MYYEDMVVKSIKPKVIEWHEPSILDLKLNPNDAEFVKFDLYKGAEDFLYKQLGIKATTSKEVFKKAKVIWPELINTLRNKAEDKPTLEAFSFNKLNLLYLIDDHYNIVDFYDARTDENEKDFLDNLERFTLDITTTQKTQKFYTDGKGGLIKLICYDKNADLPNEDYTPVVLLEFNNSKSNYKVYTGILIYKTFTFIPSISSYLEADHISDFINTFDMDDSLKYAKDEADGLYESYNNFVNNPVEVSARELINLLKKAGYKLGLKLNDELDDIENLNDEEGNAKIQEFFNTFKLTTGESAYDILSLSEVKKIFRYNKLTLLDVLSILSKEYLSYEGTKITCDLLGSIVFNLYDKQNDKGQAQSIKYEIEKEK